MKKKRKKKEEEKEEEEEEEEEIQIEKMDLTFSDKKKKKQTSHFSKNEQVFNIHLDFNLKGNLNGLKKKRLIPKV